MTYGRYDFLANIESCIVAVKNMQIASVLEYNVGLFIGFKVDFIVCG